MSDPSEPTAYRIRRPGGEAPNKGVFNAPNIVLWTVLATCLCFVLMLIAPLRAVQIIEAIAGVSPARIVAGPQANGGPLSWGAPLIAHMFIHAGIAHLAVNMLFLLAFGAPIARRVGLPKKALMGFSRPPCFCLSTCWAALSERLPL